ncbi:MAG: hypothetical protein PHX30_06545 [Candidatus Pacebacteria bacterium]|nr:hypothetical protein [Candidatus Paceibacterota bacterium]
MAEKPKSIDWSALSEDPTTEKNVKAGKITRPKTNQKGFEILQKWFTKRTIAKGMSWLVYADTGDGKTFLINSASELFPVAIIDTEIRAVDTRDLEFRGASNPIEIMEPLEMTQKINPETGTLESRMDARATIQNCLNFVDELGTVVNSNGFPDGLVIAVESMSEIWDEIQLDGKQTQAALAKKSVVELSQSGDIEWSDIKADHRQLVKALNFLRTKGVNVIHSCRRNDDSDAKTREIRSEKNLPYDIQNVVKLYTKVENGQKIHYAVFEKMLGKHCYEVIEWPTFAKLHNFVMDRVNKQLAGQPV